MSQDRKLVSEPVIVAPVEMGTRAPNCCHWSAHHHEHSQTRCVTCLQSRMVHAHPEKPEKVSCSSR